MISQYRQPESVVRFDWRVADVGYQWSSDHELLPLGQDVPGLISRAPKGPWLIDPASTDPCPAHGSYPLRRRRDLHVEFARLPLGTDEATLDVLAGFASKHGMLGIEQQMVVREGAPAGDPVYMAEHLSTWLQAIRQIGGLLDLVYAYKGEDIQQLRKYVHWFGGARGVSLEYAWPGDGEPSSRVIARDIPTATPAEVKRLKTWAASTSDRHRYLGPIEYFLYQEVDDLLKQHLAPRLPIGGGIALVPDSLFGAMVVTLAEQLSGVWRMNRCPGCGQLFVPRSRSDQRTCSTACRKRLSRVGEDA